MPRKSELKSFQINIILLKKSAFDTIAIKPALSYTCPSGRLTHSSKIKYKRPP